AFAEGQLDRLFFRAHRIEGHHQPEAHGHQRDQTEAACAETAAAATRAAAPAATLAATAHQDLRLLLALAADLVDVGNRGLSAAAAATTTATASVTAAPGVAFAIVARAAVSAAASPGATVVLGHTPSVLLQFSGSGGM